MRTKISPEAWAYFKTDYLSRVRPPATVCYKRLQHAAVEHDWQYPSLQTLMRKLRREVPCKLIVMHRHGASALKNSLIRRDLGGVE